MAEAILNRAGQGNFRAFSAGSQPKGKVHPNTLALLRKLHYDVSGARSKSWLEFSQPDSPKLDFVFTVCDNAAGEACPYWPGQPMTAHWGVPDPANATGTEAEVRLAFADSLRMLTKSHHLLKRGQSVVRLARLVGQFVDDAHRQRGQSLEVDHAGLFVVELLKDRSWPAGSFAARRRVGRRGSPAARGCNRPLARSRR